MQLLFSSGLSHNLAQCCAPFLTERLRKKTKPTHQHTLLYSTSLIWTPRSPWWLSTTLLSQCDLTAACSTRFHRHLTPHRRGNKATSLFLWNELTSYLCWHAALMGSPGTTNQLEADGLRTAQVEGWAWSQTAHFKCMVMWEGAAYSQEEELGDRRC